MLRKKFYDIDFFLISLFVLLILIGIAEQFSAAHGNIKPWAYRQIILIISFLPLFFVISILDGKRIESISYPLYIFSIILLLYLVFFGHRAMGATRWIRLRYFKLQPTEIMKISMIMALAKYFNGLSVSSVNNYKHILVALIIVVLPVFLIFLQPNFGNCVINIFIASGIFFIVGVSAMKFVCFACMGLISLPFVWSLLYGYQKKRIISFLNPSKDPLGIGYNAIQSRVAIGSGGIFGKGFLNGNQSQLDFLPEKQTDFIFTIFLEEFGMFGGMICLFLYFLLLVRIFNISKESTNTFNKLVAAGIGIMIFVHTVLNISMAVGLLPVVGVPLPFMSYGRSMLLNNLISFALLLNINRQNKKAIG